MEKSNKRNAKKRPTKSSVIKLSKKKSVEGSTRTNRKNNPRDKKKAEKKKEKQITAKKLDKKQIRAIFLFEFKMGRKAEDTTDNVNNAFGSGTVDESTVNWWFEKFRKGDENLEDEEPTVDNDQSTTS